MKCFKILKSFFTKSKVEEKINSIEDDEMYVSEASATIEIRLNSKTGDFNIVVGVDEVSDECSKNLALILYMLNSGNLSEYFTDAYQDWSVSDIERRLLLKIYF